MGFTTPFFVKNNTILLWNEKLKHLKIIKPSLQTYNGNMQNKKPNQNHKLKQLTSIRVQLF
jgi:hypothetical protein